MVFTFSSCCFARRFLGRSCQQPLLRSWLPCSTSQQRKGLSSRGGGGEPPFFTTKRLMYVGALALAGGCLVGYNQYNQQSKQQRAKMLMTLHRDVMTAREAVKEGKYEEALNHYKQARFHIDFTQMSSATVQNKVFRNIVDQLGHLAFELERWDEAEKFLGEAEMVMLEDGLEHIEDEYLHVVYELAVIDSKRGRDKEASQRFGKCIYVLETKLAKQDIYSEGYSQRLKLYGMVLTEYGTFMLKMGDLESSLQSFSKSLNICRSVLGPTHEQTSVLCNNLAAVYEELGDFEEASRYAEKAIEIATQTAPHYVADYKRNLGQILLHKGETVKGRKLIQEASLAAGLEKEKSQ